MMSEAGATGNRRLGILISGRGSNLQAILDAIADGRLDAEVAVVVSNRPEVAGLARARAAGVESLFVDPRSFDSREAFDLALVSELKARGAGLVCLAGFMRLLSREFVFAFPNAILNIHPSLLPSFPGLDAPGQALAHGVRMSGATVHIVTPELDAGPIVRQAVVEVRGDDTAETLADRILVEEHRIYPDAIAALLRSEWRLDGRRFVEDPRS